MNSGITIFQKQLGGLVLVGLIIVSSEASADTVWTDWTVATVGNSGSAVGSLNGATITYTGQVLDDTVTNGSSLVWDPASSFVGGAVSESPDSIGDIIGTEGTVAGLQILTFSESLVDPVFAIWSLGGRGGASASFDFTSTPVLQAGGPSSSLGGGSIVVSGSVNSISWTNTPENWYGFTVGTAGVPEPAIATVWPVLMAICATRTAIAEHNELRRSRIQCDRRGARPA